MGDELIRISHPERAGAVLEVAPAEYQRRYRTRGYVVESDAQEARRAFAASRESERVLQAQIDAQAKEIDALRSEKKAAVQRAADWLAEVGEPNAAYLLSTCDIPAAEQEVSS